MAQQQARSDTGRPTNGTADGSGGASAARGFGRRPAAEVRPADGERGAFPAGGRVGDPAVAAAASGEVVFRAEGDLAGLWLGVAREQMLHNGELLRRLTEARDWREALGLQQAFLRDSIARTADGLCRQVDLAGEIVAGMIPPEPDATKRAA